MNLFELIEPLLDDFQLRIGYVLVVDLDKLLQIDFSFLVSIEILEEGRDLRFEEGLPFEAFDKLFYFDLSFIA